MTASSANGIVTEVAPNDSVTARLVVPKRERWVDLPEEYPGFKIHMWVNFPKAVLRDIQAGQQGDYQRMYDALGHVFSEHNGWVDPETDDFYAQPNVRIEREEPVLEPDVDETGTLRYDDLGEIVQRPALDVDGEPLTRKVVDHPFWDAIPDELAAVVIAIIDRETARLPNSVRMMRGR